MLGIERIFEFPNTISAEETAKQRFKNLAVKFTVKTAVGFCGRGQTQVAVSPSKTWRNAFDLMLLEETVNVASEPSNFTATENIL